MERIARLSVALVLAITASLFARDIDDAAKAALESLSGAWRDGSSDGVAAYFPGGDAKVSLNLDADASGSYSGKQARKVLGEYFGRCSVSKVSLRDDGYGGSGKRANALYDYEYSDPNGAKHSGRLSISVEKSGNKWVLQSVTVD